MYLHIQSFVWRTILVEHTLYVWTRVSREFFRVTFVVVFVSCSVDRAWKCNMSGDSYAEIMAMALVWKIEPMSLESINLQSSCPFRSILYSATPEEARKMATSTNQTMIKNCQINGTRGKNNVDIMWPTAIDASSINSIAILTRFLKNIKITRIMTRTMAIITRNIIQVTTQKNIMIKLGWSWYCANHLS